MASKTHWLRSALTDEHGQYDIAYIGMGALVLIVLGAIPWVLVLASIALAYSRPLSDLWGVGAAIGAICGGFAAALGALAGYMAATRKPAA